jgi:hypothetical protein
MTILLEYVEWICEYGLTSDVGSERRSFDLICTGRDEHSFFPIDKTSADISLIIYTYTFPIDGAADVARAKGLTPALESSNPLTVT